MPTVSIAHRRLVWLAAGCWLMVAGRLPRVAAEPVEVELIDGHVVTGELDDRTDATRLWLRREETGVQLCSGIPWDQVHVVRRGERELRQGELIAASAPLKTPARPYLDITPAMIPVESDVQQPTGYPAQADRPRVESLHIEVQLARSGRGTANDGLRVFVFPLSAEGQIVPIRGQLDLTLFAEIVNARGGEYTVLRPEFRELEHANELVRKRDFANGPAVYQLPFRRFHPDVDFDVAPGAVVHARLGIAGQGVFEASADCVPLRTFSPIRDQLQLYTRQRFFPGENVGRLPQ